MFPDKQIGVVETVKRIKISRVQDKQLPTQDQQEHRSEQPRVNRTTTDRLCGLGVCELPGEYVVKHLHSAST